MLDFILVLYISKVVVGLSSTTLNFVGWVEPTQGFVGFLRLRRTNLHFDDVIAKCETQQQPISEPSPKSFYFDQTGSFSGKAALNPAPITPITKGDGK